VEVTNLTPPGVEPHDIELTADQVGALSEADLVIYLGKGFQPAVEDVISDAGESRRLDVLEGTANDPHVWLDPTMMAAIADRTASRLSEVDPANELSSQRNSKAVEGATS
jgi:zinc transport system substrate-binding protein